VIGQSAEFDYSGTQACKALKAEGMSGAVNSTGVDHDDLEVADRTYIEPLNTAYVEESSALSGDDASRCRRGSRAADGGRQTALNLR